MVALKKLQRPENAVWSRQGVIQADGDMDGTFADADSLICLECASGLGRSGDVDVIRVTVVHPALCLVSENGAASWHSGTKSEHG